MVPGGGGAQKLSLASRTILPPEMAEAMMEALSCSPADWLATTGGNWASGLT